ncbi:MULTISPECIES: hypothetical protein [unclassified Pseudoalteromonas]|uniref:hypothetical protein n=1 Tax=unclassified Pseudoalteromonas TaxID=194690 RepID=UPI0005A7835F|nr:MULTISPECIES: hypothetical protein [unclassified Pseudoalteromonas]
MRNLVINEIQSVVGGVSSNILSGYDSSRGGSETNSGILGFGGTGSSIASSFGKYTPFSRNIF